MLTALAIARQGAGARAVARCRGRFASCGASVAALGVIPGSGAASNASLVVLGSLPTAATRASPGPGSPVVPSSASRSFATAAPRGLNAAASAHALRLGCRVSVAGAVRAAAAIGRPLPVPQCVRAFSAAAADGDAAEPKRAPGILDKESIIAPDGYNRWKSVPGSFLVQLCIGSVYAWSIFNTPLTRDLGVVAQAADDWALGDVVPIFSLCAVTLGVCTATLGPWAERSGPRKVATAAALAWSSGLAVTAVGVMNHMLPLCYFGYGILGGIGWGLGYISPVSTLMRWFPDRRGLATGLALTAFGGGAMVATPINELLMRYHFKTPEFLGGADDVSLVTEAGKRFAEVGGELREVVVATASDVANLPGVAEGVYAVGTGNTGASMTFLTLSVGYLATMLTGAFMQRVPAEGWTPKGWTPPSDDQQAQKMQTTASVDYTQALRTPQFYLLWGAVFGNAVAGVSVISCAKTIMGDVFGRALPAVVTGGFAASYVAALSAANMVGRFGWASISDFLGRKNTYYLFGAGIPIAIGIPYVTDMIATSGGTLPLYIFYGGTILIVSFYGGLFSVLPAYLGDVFGMKHVGAIHGRALTAWSAAALAGPVMLSKLRAISYDNAVVDLASHVDKVTFEETFGAPMEQLKDLAATNTVTISKLLDIAPAGTVDPTPSLYNTTLYAMGGLLACAVVSNALIKPVDAKHHIASDGTAGNGGGGADAIKAAAEKGVAAAGEASRRSSAAKDDVSV